MVKKVLIISSSPRKGGNSDTLADEFMKGAKESGNIVEKISLREKKINYCTGCGVCTSGKSCPQKDDVPEILEKMVNADVIVLATPVYFYTMCGQLKTLIDRCCSRYTEMENKEFYFIVSAADTEKQSMNRIIEELKGFTICLNNAEEKGVIYGLGAWQIGDIKKNSKVMKEAFDMGKSI